MLISIISCFAILSVLPCFLYLKPKKESFHKTLCELGIIAIISISLQTIFSVSLYFELFLGRFKHRFHMHLYTFITLIEVYEGLVLITPFKKNSI